MKMLCLLLINCLLGSVFADFDDYHSTYLEKKFLDHIDPSEVKVILEIGSHHGKDAVLLQKHYNCPVFAFEASPINVQEIKKNIADHPNVFLIEKAVWNETKPISFFHCNNHPGSSACYQFDYPALAKREKRPLKEALIKYKLQEFKVEATRLDDWLLENEIDGIDLICMDLQGAELPALESLGKYLPTVKYVITEVEYQEIYKGEALFPAINDFMKKHGYTCYFQLNKKHLFNDVLFVRNDLLKHYPTTQSKKKRK